MLGRVNIVGHGGNLCKKLKIISIKQLFKREVIVGLRCNQSQSSFSNIFRPLLKQEMLYNLE